MGNGRLLAEPSLQRAEVCRVRESLHKQHHGGAPAQEITGRWASYVDGVLRRAMRQAIESAGVPGLEERLALIATGGFGRRESSPHSDVDVMVLYESDDAPQVARLMGRFVPAIFDRGLQLSHCARTLEESALYVVADATIRTSFAGCRLVCGSRALFDRLLHTIWEAVGVDSSELAREVLQRRLDERREFCPSRRGGTHNLKLSPGGLRDVQAITWSTWILTGEPLVEMLARWTPAGAALDLAAVQDNFWRLVGWRLRLHFHHRTNNDFFPGHGLSSLALCQQLDRDAMFATMRELGTAFESVADGILNGGDDI